MQLKRSSAHGQTDVRAVSGPKKHSVIHVHNTMYIIHLEEENLQRNPFIPVRATRA